MPNMFWLCEGAAGRSQSFVGLQLSFGACVACVLPAHFTHLYTVLCWLLFPWQWSRDWLACG